MPVGPRGAEGGSARDISLLDAARRFESVDRGGRRETEDIHRVQHGREEREPRKVWKEEQEAEYEEEKEEEEAEKEKDKTINESKLFVTILETQI